MEESTKKTKTIESNDPAAIIIRKLGNITSTLTSCIRSITKNNAYDAPRGGLDELSRFEVDRYLKAYSIKIPFYFIAQKRMNDAQKQATRISSDEILEVLNAHEVASILALVYLYKRLRVRIVDQENWIRVSKLIEEQLEIGSILGNALPSIGLADGMLIGGIRPIAQGIFCIADPKWFKDYRRDLKIKKKNFDLEEEKKHWGVNHLEVASRLLIQLGFGQTYAENFYNGLASPSDSKLGEDQLRIRLIGFWIDALAVGAAPSKIRGEEKIQTSTETLDALFDSCMAVRNDGLINYWISLGKKDISKDVYPALFSLRELNKDVAPDDIESHVE